MAINKLTEKIQLHILLVSTLQLSINSSCTEIDVAFVFAIMESGDLLLHLDPSEDLAFFFLLLLVEAVLLIGLRYLFGSELPQVEEGRGITVLEAVELPNVVPRLD